MPKQSSKTPTSAQTRIVGKPGHQSVKVGDVTVPIREQENVITSVEVRTLTDDYREGPTQTVRVVSDPAVGE